MKCLCASSGNCFFPWVSRRQRTRDVQARWNAGNRWRRDKNSWRKWWPYRDLGTSPSSIAECTSTSQTECTDFSSAIRRLVLSPFLSTASVWTSTDDGGSSFIISVQHPAFLKGWRDSLSALPWFLPSRCTILKLNSCSFSCQCACWPTRCGVFWR